MQDDELNPTLDPESGRKTDALCRPETNSMPRSMRLSNSAGPEMLTEMPDVAVPLVFRLLGETGAHAPLINDVVLADTR